MQKIKINLLSDAAAQKFHMVKVSNHDKFLWQRQCRMGNAKYFSREKRIIQINHSRRICNARVEFYAYRTSSGPLPVLLDDIDPMRPAD